MKKLNTSNISAVIAAIFAFIIFMGATSCTKKEKGCYTCKIYDRNGLMDVTEICDEAQVQPFKDSYQGTGLGVSCSK